MKKIRSNLACAVALAGLFGVLHAVTAANTVAKTTKGSTAPAPTNAPAVELPIPVAMFDLTNKLVKDPFFPNTLRTPVPMVITNKSVATISAACFTLKAVAGNPDQRIALINNRTLGIGESVEINTAQCGKVHISCLQIKDSSVVIRVAGIPDPVEISLPKSAQ